MYARSLHRQESRVLCLAWHPSGKYIVVGGVDSTIRTVNVATGVCTQRITLDDYKQRSTLVWDVKFVDEFLIVSASSLGKVQVWDFKHGTQQSTFRQHSADVLTLAVVEGREGGGKGKGGDTTVFASGVDSKVVKLSKIMQEGDKEGDNTRWKWVFSGQIRRHTHDVRSLAVSPTGMLASGGADGDLVITNPANFHMSSCVRYQPFPCMARHFKLAEKGSVMLYQSMSSLNLWDIANHSLSTTTSATSSPEEPTSLHLLELKAKPPHNILSSAISENGGLVAVSNAYEMWVYRFDRKTLRVTLVANLPLPSFAMLFVPARPELILATTNEGVKRVTIDTHSRASVEPLIKGVPKKNAAQVNKIDLSADGQYVATISSRWRINVYDVATGSLVTKLPKFQSLPIVCTFNPSQPELLLFAGGESREVFVYNIAEDSLQCLGKVRRGSNELYEGRTKFSHPLAIMPISFEKNLFAVYDNDCAMMFRLAEDSVQTPAKHSSGKPRKRLRSREDPLPAQVINSAPFILFVGAFNCASTVVDKMGKNGTPSAERRQRENSAGRERGLVVVERSLEDVLKTLPPTLLRKRFGT